MRFQILCQMAKFQDYDLFDSVCKDKQEAVKSVWLDERLLSSPPLAASQCRQKAKGMAKISKSAILDALSVMLHYDKIIADKEQNRSSIRLRIILQPICSSCHRKTLPKRTAIQFQNCFTQSVILKGLATTRLT